MKTHNLVIIFLGISLILMSSCRNRFWGIKGEGPVVTQTRSTDSFEGIEVSNDVEVYIKQGKRHSVQVEGQQNILDILETEVKGGKLQISYGRFNVRKHEPVKVFITNPTLTSVSISGSSQVKGESKWNLDHDDFESRISGSGKLDMEVQDVDKLDASISGSGDMNLEGDCEVLAIHISGSGNANAFDLIAETVDASVSGSGSCDITVREKLKAHASGSGDVRYKGNPKSVSSHTTGSGDITKEN